jgi:rod shape determining protein RodA
MIGPYAVLVTTLYIGFAFMLFTLEVNMRNIILILSSIVVAYILYYFKTSVPIFIIPLIGFVYAAFTIFKERKLRELSLVGFATAMIVLLSYTTNYLFEEVIKPHQQERINIWLRPEKCDPRGPLYNLIQSKLAIGSGGFLGKGFLNGEMTKLNYVPEHSTDFIFSIVGEEQGFIGTASVIILFVVLIIRCVIIAERTRLEFIRNYAYCMAGILFIHFFVNIGMTIGLMPIIGIPLPFVSRGGTSLLFFSVMMAVLIKMDSSRYRT